MFPNWGEVRPPSPEVPPLVKELDKRTKWCRNALVENQRHVDWTWAQQEAGVILDQTQPYTFTTHALLIDGLDSASDQSEKTATADFQRANPAQVTALAILESLLEWKFPGTEPHNA